MFTRLFWFRTSQVVAILLLVGIAFGASTAYACGCGIYIPQDGDAQVAQERSLLRWDGAREDIVMSLGVLGGSKQAAIILPVPAPAEVKLADSKIFDELEEMTKPLERTETEWVFLPMLGAGALPPEGGAPGAPPVNVLSRQNIGPFDVANLSATDANALKTWLDENGYALDPRITEILAPYVQNNWTFVAIRVQPEQASLQLNGDLAPLEISFESNELIYPMRSTALADNQQTVVLYVLADHRVEKNTSFGPSRVSFANSVEPAQVANTTLARYFDRKYFLTKYIDAVNPLQVDDDFKFTFAAQDTPYREVKIKTVKQDVSGLVLLACVGVMFFGFVAMVAFIVFMLRRRAPRAA